MPCHQLLVSSAVLVPPAVVAGGLDSAVLAGGVASWIGTDLKFCDESWKVLAHAAVDWL